MTIVTRAKAYRHRQRRKNMLVLRTEFDWVSAPLEVLAIKSVLLKIPARMRQTRMRPVRWEFPPGFKCQTLSTSPTASELVTSILS